MESLKVCIMRAMSMVRPFFKTVLVLLAACLAVWLLFRIFLDTATWAAYSYYFRILTSQGGLNAWLARCERSFCSGDWHRAAHDILAQEATPNERHSPARGLFCRF